MKFLSIKAGILIALICPNARAIAQHQDSGRQSDTSRLHEISEVVITANRTGSSKLQTPEAISLLLFEAIGNKQSRTAPEALNQTPGVFVQKTNHGGGSPFVRGLTGNQTLMLVDGIRLSNATFRYGPNQYFNTIDAFGTDRIEVLRGSGSVQYGSDAIGGTIQAFTGRLNYSDKPSFNGLLAGRFVTQGMEQSLRASAAYLGKTAAFRGGITARRFGDLVGGDTTGMQSPNGYDELDFDLKGQIRLSDLTEMTLALQRVHQGQVPVYHKITLENYAVNQFDPQNRHLAYARLNHQIGRGIWQSATITGSYQQTLEGRLSRKNGSSVLRKEADRVHSAGLTAEAVTSGGAWRATSGVEIYHDIVFSGRTDSDTTTGLVSEKRGLYPDGASMTSMALFSLHTLEFQKWIITTGARINSFIIKINDQALGTTRLTPSALVGNLALLRKLTTRSTLFLSLNTGFRAPNIDDLGTLGIVDFRYEVPNFDLKPEHSFQYQAGYKQQQERLRGEVFLFRNELYNLIVRNQVAGDSIEGYPVYLKENVERAFIMGAEANLSVDLTPSWSASGSVTYAYGQNITRDEPLRRIPPLFGQLSLTFHKKDINLEIEWLAAAKQDRLAAGDRDDNRIPAGGTPGWNIFNIHAGYAWRFLTVNLSFQNLLNADYRYHGSGVNGYGRSLALTVILSIR